MREKSDEDDEIGWIGALTEDESPLVVAVHPGRVAHRLGRVAAAEAPQRAPVGALHPADAHRARCDALARLRSRVDPDSARSANDGSGRTGRTLHPVRLIALAAGTRGRPRGARRTKADPRQEHSCSRTGRRKGARVREDDQK